MIFITIHTNYIDWRSDKGCTGTNPHNGTVEDAFNEIENVLKLNGLSYSQLETRLEL